MLAFGSPIREVQPDAIKVLEFRTGPEPCPSRLVETGFRKSIASGRPCRDRGRREEWDYLHDLDTNEPPPLLGG